MNGPEAQGPAEPHPIFSDFVTKFRDADVEAARQAVRHCGVVDFLNSRINATKSKAGRPATIPIEALLVGMLITALDGKGCLISEVSKTLYWRLSKPAMRLLNLRPLPKARSNREELRQRWMIERRARGALHRVLAVLDPSIHPKGKSMLWEDLRKLDRNLTDDEIEDRQRALSIVCNSILLAAYDHLPERVKRKYRGSACIDATPLRIHARGYGVDSEVASSDPDAGYYARLGDHTETGDPHLRTVMYAYDLNLMVAVDDWLGDRQYLPAIPYAMHLDRPGVDPAGASRRMMAFLSHRDHRPRYLAGDGLYALADPDAFHNPARAVGWQLVMPVLDGHLGVQAEMEGLIMVEGNWYCPSIPSTLIDATLDFRERTISEAEYDQRISARGAYRARLKGTNTSGNQRWACPASGSHPSVICALKSRSEDHKFIGGPVLGVRLKDRVIPDPDTRTNGVWPRPCRQEAVTIQGDRRSESGPRNLAADRYRQALIFGTHEHTDTYNALRQSQEGLHGFAKDDAYEALGTPGKRRVKGRAAQSLFAAFLLAAAGIRKVRTFLRCAAQDENGDLYVRRRPRKGEHATTHLPPGSPGSRGDPAVDESLPDAGPGVRPTVKS